MSTRFRTYLNYLQTPVSVYLPLQKPQSPTPLTKYRSASSDTKKKPSVSQLLCPEGEIYSRQFSVDRIRKVRSIQPCLRIVGIDNLNQTRADSISARNIDSPNFTNIKTCSKRIIYRYAKSLDNSIDAPEIPSLGLKF